MRIVAFLVASIAMLSVSCGGGGGGNPGGPAADPTVKGLLINEVCGANTSIKNASGSTYEIGDYYNTNFAEWVELINTTDATINLKGYYISNKLSSPTKWAIPDGNYLAPGGTVRFWADDLDSPVYDHMNFKVKSTGGVVALFDSLGNLVDSVTYPAQPTDLSYGRGPNGSTVWYYYAKPTPGEPNGGVKALTSTRTTAPVFSVEPGFKSTSVSVGITAASGATIRYTTDGSIPDLTSTVYSGPVPLSSTGVLKARAFTSEAMPSDVTAGTYLIGESTVFPVVSVSTNPAYLWSDGYGIYAMGPNASATAPYYGANFWNDWERPAHVELFETGGSRGLCHYAGIKINGNTTVGVPEKSMAFYAKAKYGITSFNYTLFPEDKPALTDYVRFLVRNSGQDWTRSLFRDAFTARVIKDQMDLDYQAYRPVIHFLNGQYNGVINLREKADEYLAYTNDGVDPSAVDFLEYDGKVVLVGTGSADDYNDLITYISDPNDITSSTVYDQVKTRMDVAEYINYVIAETFCGNVDWPASNVKFYRAQSGGKWRWILQDTDYAWGYRSDVHASYGPARDPFYNLLHVSDVWPNYSEGTYLFRMLIQNADFRAAFRAAYLNHLATTFEQSRILDIMDGIATTLTPEMTRQIGKWGGQPSGLVSNEYLYPTTLAEWQTHVQQVRDYAGARTAYVQSWLDAHFPSDGNLVVDP